MVTETDARNSTPRPGTTEHARSLLPLRPKQVVSDTQHLDIPNEKCWESAFTFMRLHEHILGRPAGPVNSLAIVTKPQLKLNQLQRQVITVICDQLLYGMSGHGRVDRSTSEQLRLLINNLTRILNMRACFFHEDHHLAETEFRGLISHLRHTWLEDELTTMQKQLAP